MKYHIVAIHGGLGNQMFQYAYFLSLSKPNNYCFLYIPKYYRHNGYELDRLFNIKKSQTRNIIIRLSKFLLLSLIERNIDYDVGHYKRKVLNSKKWIIYHSGYWQSEKYFIDISEKIRKTFSFNPNLISENNKLLLKQIKSQNSISVHIRRGDYIHDEGVNSILGGICDLGYFNRALKLINQKVSGQLFFYFFSDDIKYVKENFNFENKVIVDWNRGKESWQDMMLMSNCKHNIISNSSFSWWGAWLNSNKNKFVIAPKMWFKNASSPDIVPGSWIRI